MKNTVAQSTIEFTFAMITVVFLIYGMVMVFRWAGMDLANRRVVQDSSLAVPVTSADLYPTTSTSPCVVYDYSCGGDPAVQLNAEVGNSILPMAAMYHGEVANGNESQ